MTIRGVGTFDLLISLRSPVSVYRFLASLYGEYRGGRYRYHTENAKRLLAPDEPFIDIVQGSSGGCYASIAYDGTTFCAPIASANTALLFTLLQELRNLSIQSTDLNSAFTVRVTN